MALHKMEYARKAWNEKLNEGFTTVTYLAANLQISTIYCKIYE